VAVGLVADLADCLAACNDRQLRDLYLHNLLVLVQALHIPADGLPDIGERLLSGLALAKGLARLGALIEEATGS
jgi:hypothetical protein